MVPKGTLHFRPFIIFMGITYMYNIILKTKLPTLVKLSENSGNHQKYQAGHTLVIKLTMVLVPQPGR